MSKKKVVCILGMHRSGTSMLTRAINLMGVFLGPESSIMNSAQDNPEGFWENVRIVQAHEKVMNALDYEWHDSYPISEGLLSSNADLFLEELKNIVETDFVDSELWGWKDPRTCLFLPLWKKFLESYNAERYFVYIYRNPKDVSISLHARNRFSREKSRRIWTNYNLAILKMAFGEKIHVVSYDDFIENTEENIFAISRFIDVPISKEVLYEIKCSVKPTLRHSKSENTCHQNEDEAEQLFNALEKMREGKDVQNTAERLVMQYAAKCREFEIDIYEKEVHKYQIFTVSTLYIDSGSGFSEKESIKKSIRVIEQNKIRIEFNLEEELSPFSKLRWDPAEGKKLSIKVLSAGTNEGNCEISPINAVYSKQGVDFFDTIDPMYDVKINSKKITKIFFDVVFLGASTQHNKTDDATELPDCYEIINEIVNQKEVQALELREQGIKTEDQKKIIEDQNRAIEEQSKAVVEQINTINNQKKKIEEQTNAVKICSEKLEVQSQELRELNKRTSEQYIALEEQKQMIAAITESKSWKFISCLRRITSGFNSQK